MNNTGIDAEFDEFFEKLSAKLENKREMTGQMHVTIVLAMAVALGAKLICREVAALRGAP